MNTYLVTVIKYATIQIEAESEEAAFDVASAMDSDAILEFDIAYEAEVKTPA